MEIPIGGILGWDDLVVNIPVNYVLLDGSGGYLDLTNRTIVGAGDEYAVGDAGGFFSNEYTLPVHDHPAVPTDFPSEDGQHTHDASASLAATEPDLGSAQAYDGTGGTRMLPGSHAHDTGYTNDGGGDTHSHPGMSGGTSSDGGDVPAGTHTPHHMTGIFWIQRTA